MVNKNLVEAINKLIKNISEDYANEVLYEDEKDYIKF